MNITKKAFSRLERRISDALELASNHDPDLTDRINILERQVERLGAKPYRVVRSSHGGARAGIYSERVRRRKS